MFDFNTFVFHSLKTLFLNADVHIQLLKAVENVSNESVCFPVGKVLYVLIVF